jgi:hypothetical protein
MHSTHRTSPGLVRVLAGIALTAALHATVSALAHDGHPTHHHHGHATEDEKHPTTHDASRFITNRSSEIDLPLPEEEDSFFFVVFGDRTGGPASGVEVLSDAVQDVNLLEPDLVMTVGDLVQGYNMTDEWMDQMREFKGIMDGLKCPWFPVAGNHDIYWRGPDKPEGEHEASYEMHFGPLWYAFEHKDCWFVVLYSDEGNPVTGEKSINKPDTQTMSPQQLQWLKDTMQKTKEAKHVFVFLHHPRWIGGNYGDDWEKVHRVLADAGNVTAVFGGHIHYMRHDGVRDGIEYVTLATVGGVQSGIVPSAGYLHQYHIVTVRPDHIALSSLPVGELMDVRAITDTVAHETARLAQTTPQFDARISMDSKGRADQAVTGTLRNPTSAPIDVTVMPASADSRWQFAPDHHHATIQPGESKAFTFHAQRVGDGIDFTFRVPQLLVHTEYLSGGWRFPLREQQVDIPLQVDLPAQPAPEEEMVVAFDGRDACLRIPSSLLEVPDGPLTLECWFNAQSFGSRTGLLAKTESSEYGFFVNAGVPSFSVFIAGHYIDLMPENVQCETGRWYHLAGVYDGAEARLYLDGQLIAAQQREGTRGTNSLPLYVGADVDRGGNAMSYFHGMVDGVRLSTSARYAGPSFEPPRRMQPDASTVLLLNMDRVIGIWTCDESGRGAHAILNGSAKIIPADE